MKIAKILPMIALASAMAYAQTPPSGGSGSTTTPVPVATPSVAPTSVQPIPEPPFPFNNVPVIGNLPKVPDHYSWAMPLADLLSYAKQAVRNVSGYVAPKTILPSSKQQNFNFGFASPRVDGVVLAEDINKALATNKFDVVIAQSETGFSGNINLSDASHETLFNGGFWVDASGGDGQKIKVTYYLADKISLQVPEDLRQVKIILQDEYGNTQNPVYIYPQQGRIRMPTNIGMRGTVQALFNDGTAINFSNGLAESEKRITTEVSGDFANTFTFPKGSTMIVLGLQEWMLNNQGEFVAVFEPSSAIVNLYAELPGKTAKTVRLRQLPSGFTVLPTGITPGKALKLQLPSGPLGVWEATFSFEIERRGEKGGGGAG